MRVVLLLWLLPAMLCAEELAPWNSNHDATDVARQYVQDCVAGRQEYRVVQGGTMDGRNCRSPQGVWTPFEQTWESNRAVRMENVGDVDVVNPWLSNGRNDFRSMQAIVERATEPTMTDKEKATALWWQQIQHRFHNEGDNNELANPVKVLSVYGYNTCGNDSICMAGLWKAAGLRVAPARLVGHCVTQVFYEGAWHLYDGDMHSVYLLRDNETIASEQDLVRDHDLIKRTHTQGILRPQERAGDEWESSIYVFEGEVTGDRNADGTAMNMTLRPGESLVWRWGHTQPPKFFGSSDHKFEDRVCNGLWEYRPDFSSSTWRAGADSIQNIAQRGDGLAAERGKVGEVVWAIRAPYVIVGGKLDFEGSGAQWELSWDGKSWQQVARDLDASFPRVGQARYAYYLRCRLAGAARLHKLVIVNDLQMAPLSLPEMAVGENDFVYTDESPGERQVRITHEWIERSASEPPAPPSAPISPPDRGEVEGTDVVFEWQPAWDPDSDAITDYHFELSSRPDMKWPLSMSFAKLISRTGDAKSARYSLEAAGELNPDQPYYWRMRAKDSAGVWGSWSRTWSFSPRGPAPPIDVTLEYDREHNHGVLKWSANPMGRAPTSYRVYASDEKGFSVSDQPFSIAAGVYDVHRKEITDPPTKFSANFLAETRSTELAVIGPDVQLSQANKAYYRVVAVDEVGNRSGPSDYVEATRPVIYSKPVVEASVEQPYRYDVLSIYSLGDVRTRVVDGRERMNFWDVETLRFTMEQGPSWLRVDAMTGRCSGKPDRPGRSEVVISVTLEREQRRLDPSHLQWGVEKAVDTGIEIVGTATQSFTIDVQPAE